MQPTALGQKSDPTNTSQPASGKNPAQQVPGASKPKVPVTKRFAAKSTSKNIKEMLLESKRLRRRNLVEAISDDEDIRLPDFLLEYTNIRAVTNNNLPTYEPSELAEQYAKCHSNIEEVVKLYLERKNQSLSLLPRKLGSALAVCISYPLKRLLPPFNMFLFDSPYHEEVCRTLLRNPGIETQQQLDEFLQFSNKHHLSFASVSMMKDNDVYSDSQYYFRRLQALEKTDKIPTYTRLSSERHIQHKYYERQNVVQYMVLSHMSLEDMERITNFEKIVRKEMIAQKQPEVHYKSVAQFMLQAFKDNPSIFLESKHLVIYPLYEIIANNLTDEQQELIASDFDKFCKCINISKVCKSQSPRLTKEDAYRMYVERTQTGRKLPPFHRMLWIGCEDSDIDASTEPPLQPSTSATNLAYQRRPRFERNAEPVNEATVNEAPVQRLEDESSSDTSRTTTIRRPQSTPVKPQRRTAIDSPTPEAEPELSPVLEQSLEPENVPPVLKTPEPPNKTAEVLQTPSNAETSSRMFEFTPTVYTEMPAAIPDRYLNEDIDVGAAAEITGMLLANSSFVKELKDHLKLKYPVGFEIHWSTSKKLISTSFVYFCWMEDLQQLLDILEKCDKTETKAAAEMIAERLAAQTNLTQSKLIDYRNLAKLKI